MGASPRTRFDNLTHRQVRLEANIADELTRLFRDEISDPDLSGLELVRIDLTRGHVRVTYLVEPFRADEVRAALKRAEPFIRFRVGEALQIKRTPTLGWTALLAGSEGTYAD